MSRQICPYSRYSDSEMPKCSRSSIHVKSSPDLTNRRIFRNFAKYFISRMLNHVKIKNLKKYIRSKNKDQKPKVWDVQQLHFSQSSLFWFYFSMLCMWSRQVLTLFFKQLHVAYINFSELNQNTKTSSIEKLNISNSRKKQSIIISNNLLDVQNLVLTILYIYYFEIFPDWLFAIAEV